MTIIRILTLLFSLCSFIDPLLADRVAKCNATFEDVMSWMATHGETGKAPDAFEAIVPLFMIIHIASQGQFRTAHRNSWALLAGVCNVDAKNSTKATGLSLRPVDRRGDPCRVYYTFIVGTDGTAETSTAIRQESEAYNDVTVLKLAIDPAPHERGNNTVLKSKVKLMFGYVVHNFQWATHYMKGDIDTYPLFNILMSLIQSVDTRFAPKKLASGRIPVDWSEDKGGIYMGSTMAATSKDHDNGFQQGQLYVLSRSLATCMMKWEEVRFSSNDSNVRHHGECYGGNSPRGEDSMVGAMVETAYVKEYGNYCPPPLYVNVRNIVHQYTVKKIRAPESAGSNTTRSYLDWTSFEGSATSVDRAVYRTMPGFKETFECTEVRR